MNINFYEDDGKVLFNGTRKDGGQVQGVLEDATLKEALEKMIEEEKTEGEKYDAQEKVKEMTNFTAMAEMYELITKLTAEVENIKAQWKEK